MSLQLSFINWRHKVRTQQYQLSSIVAATPIAVHQFFHRTRYLFHPVSGIFISLPFQRQLMCRFISFPCNSLQTRPQLCYSRI
ncbi:hypothetical protein ERO13_D04G069101v2 [Gossypium hirsutum]|nr:hypothetical protein ERO13_D04G069101v2 [Gossypium hirsutum]